MKSRYVLAGTVVLLAIMLASVGFAVAQFDYSPSLEVPAKLKGIVWYFKTFDDLYGAFDGRDVIRGSVLAWCWGNDYVPIYIKPVLILKTQNYVFFFFRPKDLPTGEIIGTTVMGDLTDGGTFYASGPGFAFGGHTTF